MSKFQSPQFAIYSESPSKFLSHLRENPIDLIMTEYPYVYEYPVNSWIPSAFKALKPGGYFGILANTTVARGIVDAADATGFVRVLSPNFIIKDNVCNINSSCFILFRKGSLLWINVENFPERNVPITPQSVNRNSRDSLTDFLSSRILKFSLPGDVVADPFCSVGDVGFAAVRLGRRFIGNQVEHAWSNLARDRFVDGQIEMIKLMKRGEI